MKLYKYGWEEFLALWGKLAGLCEDVDGRFQGVEYP